MPDASLLRGVVEGTTQEASLPICQSRVTGKETNLTWLIAAHGGSSRPEQFLLRSEGLAKGSMQTDVTMREP